MPTFGTMRTADTRTRFLPRDAIPITILRNREPSFEACNTQNYYGAETITNCNVLRRRLFPTAAQSGKLADLLKTHRRLYNLCLDHRLAVRATTGSWGYWFTPSGWFKDIRSLNPEFAELNSDSAAYILRLVEWRLNDYLLGLEIGESRERLQAETPWNYNSLIFRCKVDSMRPSESSLFVPGIGLISVQSLPLIEWPDSRFTVTRDSQGWLLTAFKRGDKRQDDDVEAEGGLAQGVSAVAGGTHVGRKCAAAFVPYVPVCSRPGYADSVSAEHPLYLRCPGEDYRRPKSGLVDVRSPLLPTEGQRELLDKMLEVHRRIFLRRLEQRMADYTTTGSSRLRITASAWLKAERRTDPGLQSLDSQSAKLTVRFMDRRFAAYMHRVRSKAAPSLAISNDPTTLAFMTFKSSGSAARLAYSCFYVRGVGMLKGESLPTDAFTLSNCMLTSEDGEWLLITSQPPWQAAVVAAAKIKVKKPSVKAKAVCAKRR